MPAEHLSGSCSCGKITYTVKARLDQGYACHCTDCQTRTGSAFAALLPAAAAGLEVWGQTQTVVQLEGQGVRSIAHVCPDCLTRLFNRNPLWPDLAIMRAGTLERSSEFVPALHIFTRSAQPWISFPESAVTLTEQPTTPDEWRNLLLQPGRTQ